jgi:hypothetical protein
VQLRLVADHVDEVVDHPPLAAHDQIEVAQADVEVDRDRLLSLLGDAGRDVCAGGGLSDPAFTRSDDDDFGHREPPSQRRENPAACCCPSIERAFRRGAKFFAGVFFGADINP